MGKRQALAKAFGAVGAIPVLGALRARFTRDVTILAYHRVLDVPDEEAYPFDIELVSASTDDFRRQMQHLKRHYRPTTFEAVLRVIAAGGEPPAGSVIVTFDDGFDDNYRFAYPILRELGVPATIFLSTGYLDAQDLFWYERLAWSVMTSPASAASDCGLASMPPRSPSERRAAIAAALKELKRVPNGERLAKLEAWFAALPTSASWRADGRSAPLTWDQVREMSANGIEFGSHTVTHPVLSQVPLDGLEEELVGSRRRIEGEIGRTVEVIAYPVGGEEAFDANVRAGVEAAGYKLGASYIPGVQSPARWDPFALRRLHVERYTRFDYFKAMMAAPALFR